MSNFDFLLQDYMTEGYYPLAKDLETLYSVGVYSNELVTARKIGEKMSRDILDLNYLNIPERATFNDNLYRIKTGAYASPEMIDILYKLKKGGNDAAHTEKVVKREEGLDYLKYTFTKKTVKKVVKKKSYSTSRKKIKTSTTGRIVGNLRSKIYHVPGQASYRMSSANAVYFRTEAQAKAAGYRRALR